MVLLTECKTKECQNKLKQLQWKEQERGRRRKVWRDEVEEDLNTMGLKKKAGKWPETVGDGGRLY
jgi:hypothetical protein